MKFEVTRQQRTPSGCTIWQSSIWKWEYDLLLIIFLLLIGDDYISYVCVMLGRTGRRSDWVFCFLNKRSQVLLCSLISTFSTCFQLMKPVELHVNLPVDFNRQQIDPRSVLSWLPYNLRNAIPPSLSRLCLTYLPHILTSQCILFFFLIYLKQELLFFSKL